MSGVTLYREIDALGGAFEIGDDWSRGYNEALTDVLETLAKRGFSQTDVLSKEAARTLAAGRIIDIMTGGRFDWRAGLEDSNFLESADWLTALAYADAARAEDCK